MGVRIPAAVATLLAACLLVAACSPRFDWREIAQPAAGYVVALPDKPQTAKREIVFEHPGGAVRGEMTMLSAGVGASLFAVGTVRLPPFAVASPAALDATLDWFAAGLLRNVQAGPPSAADAGSPAGLGARPAAADRRDLRCASTWSMIASSSSSPWAPKARFRRRRWRRSSTRSDSCPDGRRPAHGRSGAHRATAAARHHIDLQRRSE